MDEKYLNSVGTNDCFDWDDAIENDGREFITLPEGLMVIGENAFTECSKLSDAAIPSTVTDIGTNAFAYCKGLTSVTVPGSVANMGETIFFECTGLRSAVIRNGVTTLSRGCFLNCSGLTTVTLPAGLQVLGEQAFGGCSGLVSVTIPSSVIDMGVSTFVKCSSLVSVTIQEGVMDINTGCFGACAGMTEISLPNSIRTIGENAFAGCSSLKDVYYKGTETQKQKLINEGGISESGNNALLYANWHFNAQGEYNLSKDKALLPYGKSTTLKVTDKNGKTVTATWSSSDATIATVSKNGVVTAKKVGRAVITATVDGTALTCDVRVLFKDVTDPSLFYYEPIYNMVDKGVIGGYDDGTFRPTGNCNRAAVVTFLWKLAGRPEPGKMATFSDMTTNADFNKAISWAAEEGITSGWSDNTFRPWNTCNRAAIVTFLWRYAGEPEPKAMATFKDMTGNSDFDKAISWAAENGITTGYAGNLFKPWNTCNRLAVASFLDRYDKL